MKTLRSIFFMIIALAISGVVKAQELKVVSFEKLLTDVTARSTAVKDGNGDVCALIKVSLPVAGSEFDGNIVGRPEFRISEYWVYMTPSSKKLTVRCPNSELLDVDFGTGVESAVTYRLRLSGYSTATGNLPPVQTNVSTSSNTINGHEYVDLGLPSGLKWATCNVGASSPSAYGDYYAWGETTPKSEYTEENCKTWKKSLGDISGNPQYDAARANWGGSWRLPSKTECEELKSECTWTWTSQGGHKGYKVTGPNGNSIFVPAAGWRYGSSLYRAGDGSGYWSSTPYKSSTQRAYSLDLYSGIRCVDWRGRDYGLSVRPVSE